MLDALDGFYEVLKGGGSGERRRVASKPPEKGWLSSTPNAAAVLQLIQPSHCSAYDLEFVSVAMQLGVQFVTYDRQVLAAFPTIGVTPEAFVA